MWPTFHNPDRSPEGRIGEQLCKLWVAQHHSKIWPLLLPWVFEWGYHPLCDAEPDKWGANLPFLLLLGRGKCCQQGLWSPQPLAASWDSTQIRERQAFCSWSALADTQGPSSSLAGFCFITGEAPPPTLNPLFRPKLPVPRSEAVIASSSMLFTLTTLTRMKS